MYYTTPEVSEEQATVRVQTTIINRSGETATIRVGQALSSQEHHVLAEASENIVISAGEKREIVQVLTIQVTDVSSASAGAPNNQPTFS